MKRKSGCGPGLLGLGLFFAFVFGAIDQLGGEPFFAGDVKATVALCVYFSFVTLATLGYGDILPATPIARGLAVFEAIFGQLYLAVMVARLVSLRIAAETQDTPP